MPHTQEDPGKIEQTNSAPQNKEGVNKSPEFVESLKRVEGLYYSDSIAQDTEGRKGRRVTREALLKGDPRDLESLLYVRSHGVGSMPDNIYNFVLEVTKDFN